MAKTVQKAPARSTPMTTKKAENSGGVVTLPDEMPKTEHTPAKGLPADHEAHRAAIAQTVSGLSDPRERLKVALAADATALRTLVESGASKAQLLAWIDESDAHRGDLMCAILG